MRLLDGRCQHDDFAGAARRQCKAARRRADIQQHPQLRAKPAGLDAQPGAMRFIGMLGTEHACDQRASRQVAGPGFTQQSRQCEQHRARRERHYPGCVLNHVAACVDDDRPGCEERFDLFKRHQAFRAVRDQARRGPGEDEGCALDLGRQRRDVGFPRRMLGPAEGCARRLGLQAPDRDARNHQLLGSPRCRRQRRGVERGQAAFRLVEAADQEQATDLQGTRVRRIHAVAMRFERRPRALERRGRPGELARDQRDLGLGDHAARARQRLLWAERPRGSSQQCFRSLKIAELRHHDASQRQRRRVVAQGDALQCAEKVARRERARGGSDQRVHRNRVTLVTPLSDSQRLVYLTTNNHRRAAMRKHTIGTRQEWLTARLELLEAEKDLTRRSDELARRRQELPWVRIDKQYRFETDTGSASLPDLFKGRSQLLVYHFMFGTDWTAGCPSCSMIADGFNGSVIHLANHDVMLWAVSRTPLQKLQVYQRRMGWNFPWASSQASDFNFDFSVSYTKEQQREGVEYNFHRASDPRRRASEEGGGNGAQAQFAAMCGVDVPTFGRDRPGMSAFVLKDGIVYHTYSSYARGLDGLWGAYQWLDRAPKGRNETGIWWHRHDEYDKR